MPISKVLLILLGLFVLTIGSSEYKSGASSLLRQMSADPAELDQSLLREGDILLRKGQGFVSDLIAMAFAEDLSHCGIVVRDEDGWKVIHTISGRISDTDGIRMDRVEDFVAQAQKGSVYHVSPVWKPDREGLGRQSRIQLAREAAFDHRFDLEESEKLYCSELIRLVYLESGSPDLFLYKQVGGKRLIDMASFLDERFFETVQGL